MRLACIRVKKMKNIKTERYEYEKTCEILKCWQSCWSTYTYSQLFTHEASPSTLSVLYLFTLPFFCSWLLPCLRRSSHIWQDIAIKELPVSRRVRTSFSLYTTHERKLQILNWKSRRASCFSRSAYDVFKTGTFPIISSLLWPLPYLYTVSDSLITIIVCLCLSQIKNSMQSADSY